MGNAETSETRRIARPIMETFWDREFPAFAQDVLRLAG
jgi:hypothetical protein